MLAWHSGNSGHILSESRKQIEGKYGMRTDCKPTKSIFSFLLLTAKSSFLSILRYLNTTNNWRLGIHKHYPVMDCYCYLFVSVIKYHDQGKLYKVESILADGLRIRRFHPYGREAW